LLGKITYQSVANVVYLGIDHNLLSLTFVQLLIMHVTPCM